MKKITKISELPSTLDVKEMMAIRGGLTNTPNDICIGGSAKHCEGTVGVVVCPQGVSAITISCSPNVSAVTCSADGSALG